MSAEQIGRPVRGEEPDHEHERGHAHDPGSEHQPVDPQTRRRLGAAGDADGKQRGRRDPRSAVATMTPPIAYDRHPEPDWTQSRRPR